jgi:hypothetical protein
MWMEARRGKGGQGCVWDDEFGQSLHSDRDDQQHIQRIVQYCFIVLVGALLVFDAVETERRYRQDLWMGLFQGGPHFG